MWWRSQYCGGCAQPGNEQPPSRAINARVCDRLAIRRLPPRSNTAPDAASTVGMISALLASCSISRSGACAVGGSAVADPAGQVVGVDGDDHRRRNTAGIRNVPGPQLSVAEIFEGVVGALSVGPAVDFTAGIDPEFCQRVEQGLEFGAGGPGEPEVPDIGTVPGGPQMKVAAIFVELVVRHGPVRVDPVDNPAREQLQVLGRKHPRVFGEQRLTLGDAGGVETAPIHLL